MGLSRLRLLRRRCHLYVVRKGSSLKQLSPFAEYGGNDTMQQAGNPLFVYNYFYRIRSIDLEVIFLDAIAI